MTIEVLKRELTITWDDAETNEKVLALAERAKGIIPDKAGRELDFETPSTAQQLFFDCIKYLRSDAYNQFLEDYSSELTALRLGGGENGTA